MQPVREVYSLLMPILDGRIIVPRAAVAEVTGYVRPKGRPEGAPDFLLGFIDWQGQKIPLVSIEAAGGRGVPEHDRRTRIAIVFGITGHLDPDVFAVVTQGYPYLVRVNENVLQREEMKGDETLMLARVRMANEKPYIPDFEKLEALIARALGLAPASGNGAVNKPVDELEALGGDEEEFDAGIAGIDETSDDALSFDVDDVAQDETATDSGPDVDLGEVTAFGTETNYSAELDALSDALTGEADVMESPDADGEPEISVDLDEVTVFGTETNYSVELDELSGALETGEPAADDEYAVDLSALELDSGENADDRNTPTGDANASPAADDEYSIDLSGLELDSGENADDAKTDGKPENGAEDAGEYDFSGLDLELDDDGKKPE